MSALAITFRPISTMSRPTTLCTYAQRSPQLTPVVSYLSAPWLPSLLTDLRALETSGHNIPGVGDLRIAPSTADHVRRLMTLLSVAPLPEPTLVPFSGGGIVLSWNVGARELSFSAYPDHDDFVFTRTDDNDEIAADGLITFEQKEELGKQISAFLTASSR